MFELTKEESAALRSKFSTLEASALTLESVNGKGRHSKYNFKAFTRKGLYMLATCLKSDRAADATVAIVETFDKVQTLKQELLELHNETDKEVQKTKMQHFGEVRSQLIRANDVGYLTPDEYTELYNDCRKLSAAIMNFIKEIRTSEYTGAKFKRFNSSTVQED